MKLRSHSDAVNAIRLAVSEMGGLSVKYTTGMFAALDDPGRKIKVGEDGTSDLLACIAGRFIGIEVKFSDGDTQRANQQRFQAALERAGGIYVLADFRRGQDGVADLRRALHAR
jgi:hypothetical protein